MAKEILKDELLNDDQLENVAGGTVSQTASDSQFLRDIGVNGENEGFGGYFTGNNFDEVSGIVQKGWDAVGIVCTPNADGDNTYIMKSTGKEISRKDAYKEAMRVTNINKPLSRYDFKTK